MLKNTRPFWENFGLIHTKKRWSQSGQQHQQGSRLRQVQGKLNLAWVGSEIRKLSIHYPWGQRHASFIWYAVLVRSWPHCRFPRQFNSWDNRLCTTKWLPLPNWHKEVPSAPQEVPRGWYKLIVDHQHRKARKFSGRIWCPFQLLQWWRQCYPLRRNTRLPRRSIALKERVWFVIQNVPR